MEKPILPALKTLFIVHLIVALVFGLIYLLVPSVMESLFGWPIKDPVMARTIGAAVLGYGASSWLAYRETSWEKVKIIVLAEVVWTVLGALVALWGQLAAAAPAVGWLNFVILGAFAVAFGWFYMQNSAVESAKAQQAKMAR